MKLYKTEAERQQYWDELREKLRQRITNPEPRAKTDYTTKRNRARINY